MNFKMTVLILLGLIASFGNSYLFLSNDLSLISSTWVFTAYIVFHLLMTSFLIQRITSNADKFSHISLSLLALSFSWVLALTTGKPFSGGTAPFHFLVLILVGTLNESPLVLFILIFDAAVLSLFHFLNPASEVLAFLMLHIGFGLMFTLYYRFILEGEIIFRKQQFKNRINNFYREMEKRAENYGLGKSQLDGEPMTLAGIQQVESQIEEVFNLLKNYNGIERAILYLKKEEETGEGPKLIPVNGFGSLRQESKNTLDQNHPFFVPFFQTLSPVTRSAVMQTIAPPYLGSQAYGEFSCTPIVNPRDDQFLGFLIVDSKQDRRLPSSIESILVHSALMISHILREERQIRRLDHSLREQSFFFETLKELNRVLDLNSVCNIIQKLIREIMELDVLIISSANPEDKSISMLYEMGNILDKKLEDFSLNKNTLAFQAISQRQPFPMENFDANLMRVFSEEEDLSKLSFVRVYPLLVRNKAIGVMMVGSSKIKELGYDQHNYLTFLADHVAFGIMNSILYMEMEKKAIRDGLTGLYNHRRFQEILNEAMKRADRSEKSGKILAFLLVDVDHFKSVNDNYGHRVGDMVLKRLAELLQESARKTDWPCRYGGEEFAIVAEMVTEEGSLQLAERIRGAMEAEVFSAPEGDFSVTLSIGVSLYPKDTKVKEDLIENADKALYYCKENGRNQVRRFIEEEVKQEPLALEESQEKDASGQNPLHS